MAAKLTFSGFSIRFLAALVLVFITYNPAGYSFGHWAMDGSISLPLRLLSGVVLIIGWVVFVRATMRSLGGLGMVLVAALLACILWVLVDFGWLPVDNVTVLSYTILLMLALLLAIGMSWSHVRRRLSGQVDVDEVDE